MSTTTHKGTIQSHDPTSDLYELGAIEVEFVTIPTGRPPKMPTKAEDLLASLGYVNVPSNRCPTHPGEILLEDFLKPLRITRRQLAADIHLPYRHVNAIINGRRPVTPAIALRLTRYLGMSVGFWMNLQLCWDLYHAVKDEAKVLGNIKPLPRPDMPELMKLAGIEENDIP